MLCAQQPCPSMWGYGIKVRSAGAAPAPSSCIYSLEGNPICLVFLVIDTVAFQLCNLSLTSLLEVMKSTQ